MSENVVEIGGHRYRYKYDPASGKTLYLGPVGDGPELSEEEFLRHYTNAEREAIMATEQFQDWKDERQSLEAKGVLDPPKKGYFHAFKTDTGKDAPTGLDDWPDVVNVSDKAYVDPGTEGSRLENRVAKKVKKGDPIAIPIDLPESRREILDELVDRFSPHPNVKPIIRKVDAKLVRSLARETKWSERTIQRAIDDLEDENLLDIRKPRKRKKKKE